MIQQLKPLIRAYRDNLELKDSPIIRAAVDYVDVLTGKPISDEQIGGILVCLLYVSTENTALGLSATITDLAINRSYWNKVRNDSRSYVKTGNFKDLVKQCDIVEACFNESARTNTHTSPLNRYPVNKMMQIGNYYVGHVDSVGICAPLLMCDDLASDLYSDPGIYKPERFMGEHKESTKNLDLLSFGAFTHLCPGRQFAKLEIKIATALITNTFEPFDLGSNIPPNNYFSPSAFAERIVPAILKLSPEDVNDELFETCHNNNVVNIDSIKVIKLRDGWLLKEYFNVAKQIEIYKYLVELSSGSLEQSELPTSNPKFSFPLSYYNLVYCNSSNCSEPLVMFEYAKEIWSVLTQNRSELDFNGDEKFEPNSLYAAMFTRESTMKLHKDQGCDWGISISLGASTHFKYGDYELVLESGDVLIGDFSKIEHAVEKITDDVPEWFGGDYDDIETFGKSRVSIQIRKVVVNNDPITIEQFKNMLVSY